MRKFRRMISWIMLMVMLATLIPSGALAAETPTGETSEAAAVEEPQSDTEDAVDAVVAEPDEAAESDDEEATVVEETTGESSENDAVESAEEGTSEEEASEATTEETAQIEEPSEEEETSSEATTEDAGLGDTSIDVAPVVEPVKKDEKEAGDEGMVDMGELFDYVKKQNGTVKEFIHLNGEEVKKDEKGNYIVDPAKNPYRLIIRTSNTGFEPGVYSHQLPAEFEYEPDSGQIKDGDIIIGTFDILATGLLKVYFNENANYSQNVTASMGFDVNFGGENHKIYPIDDISVIIDKNLTGIPEITKKAGTYDATNKRFTWSITVDCDSEANAVGMQVIDNVGNAKDDKKNMFTSADKDKGIEVSASIGGEVKAKWTLNTGSNGFNWRQNDSWGNYGWDYTIPEKAPSNASIGAGTVFGEDWDFKFTCYTTRLIEPSTTPGSSTYYFNRAWLYDDQTQVGYSRGYKVFYGPGPGYSVKKEASWSGENNQREYMNWKITGTISDLVETDVFNFSDRLMITDTTDGNSPTTINHADVPEWEEVVGELTFKDSDGKEKTETVYIQGDGPVSESGFYFETQDDEYKGDKLLRIYIRNAQREANSLTGTGINGKATLVLTYKQKLTTALRKLMVEVDKDYLYNTAWIRRNDKSLTYKSTYCTYKVPKKTIVQKADKNNEYTVKFHIDYTPSVADVSQYDSIIIEDTMSDTLSYKRNTLVVTATGINGYKFEPEWDWDYTDHVLKIIIKKPGVYNYLIDYDAQCSNDLNDANSEGDIEYYNSFGAIVNGEKITYDETEAKLVEYDSAAHRYVIDVNKVDEDGKGLAEVPIAIYLQDGKLFKQKTTDKDGKVSFATSIKDDIIYVQNIPYYVQEVEAPKGYKLDTTKYWFVISDKLFEGYQEDSYWKQYFGDKKYKIIHSTSTGDSSSGTAEFEIINKLDLTEVPVQKIWSDNNNEDNIRPSSVTIKLLADNKDTGKTLTLNAGNNWKGTFKDLKIYNESGKEIVYEVSETAPTDYTVAISGNAKDGFTVTNSHTPKLNIPVEKVWDDGNNQDGIRPASITVKLLADGKDVDGSQVTLDGTVDDKEKEAWKYTWENLPKNKDGVAIKYTVDEVSVPKDYTKTISGNATVGYKITNTHTPVPTSVSVEKVWDDSNNQDGIRPASITVKLLADGKDVDGSQVILDGTVDDKEKEAWKYTWENLPKNKDGVAIKYTVDEVSVPKDYTKTISGNATAGYKIKNTHRGDVTEISVEKVWDDGNNQDGIRPASITVKLLADGKDVDGSQVTLDGTVDDKEEEAWKYTWENLPKNKDGVAIKYTVDEVSVPKDYTKTISGDATAGYKIKNTHTPVPTSVSVEKVWDDSNNQDGIRPASITVKLLADGAEVKDSQVILDGTVDDKEKEAWKYTWENLPKNKEGVAIKYTVDEVSVPKDYSKTISGNATVGYKIKNTHNPVPTSVSVEKVWDDSNNQDGIRPASITVKLLADGAEVKDSQVILDGTVDDKEKEAWKYTWENLPKNKEGVAIKYTVDEVSVPKDYTKSISGDATVGYKIKNTHKKDKTEVSVEKVWADHNDQDEARPASISVQLLADGKVVTGSQVTLDGEIDDKEKAAWNYTWEDLDKNKDGVEIKYTVDEVSVPEGYTKTISGDAKAGYTITNTHDKRKVSISKVDATSMKEVKGAQIQLIDAKGAIVDKWTSTDDGKPHVVHGLTPGETYTLHETVEPLGYTIASDTTFSVDTEGKVTSSGTVTEGNVVLVEDNMTKVNVRKVDAANDKELPGATLQILDSEGNVVVVKDHEGNDVKCEWISTEEDHVVEGLTAGVEYTLHETVSPLGFTVTSDTKFTIDADNKVTSTGTVSKAKDGTPVLVVKDTMTVVEVSKVAITGEKELKGASIQILDSEGNVATVKDHEGNDVKCEWVSTGEPHKVEGLEIDKTYMLRETIQPDGYTIATDATFSIDKDNKVTYSGKKNDSGVLLIEDEPTKVKISKTDVAHEKELQGATLQILDSEGNVVEIKDNDGNVVEKCEWVSGKEPKYIEGLKTNVVYTLREITAPKGYTIATDIQFTIKDDGTVESTGKSIKAEETEDGVEVLLVEDELTKVKVSKVDIANSEELPGATLQILDEKGNVVVIKDNDGKDIEKLEWKSGKEPKYIEGLPTGIEYTLRETIAPDGYTIASDTKFTINEKGEVTSSGTTSTDEEGNTVLVVEDDLTHITVSKVDTGTGKELPGAKIQIIDEKGKVVEEWTSTTEPHKIDGLKTGVKYILREKVAPFGYTLTSDTTFTIDEKGNVTSTGTVNKEGMLVIEDTITEVEILKVDAKTGKGLAGAKLQVLDDNGTVCEEWESTTEAHKITGLYTGVKYTLHEVSAPKGYKVAKDVTFTMDEYGKVSGDSMKDGMVIMKDEQNPPPKNKTGDEANGALWALLLALAGGALGGTVWFKRKRKI